MNGKFIFNLVTGLAVIGGLALIISKLLSSDENEEIVKADKQEHKANETTKTDSVLKHGDLDRTISTAAINIGDRHHVAVDEIGEILNKISTATTADIESKNDVKIDEIFGALNSL